MGLRNETRVLATLCEVGERKQGWQAALDLYTGQMATSVRSLKL